MVADTPTTTVDTVAIIEEKKDILAPVITAAVTTAPVSPKETTNDKGVKRKTMASSESDDVDVDASMGVSKKSKKDDEDSTLEKLIAEKIKITMAAFEAKRKTEMAEKKKRAIEDAKKKRPLLPVQTIQTVQPVQPIQPVQIAQATPSISSIKPLVTVTDKEKTKDEEVKTEKKKEESKKKKEKKEPFYRRRKIEDIMKSFNRGRAELMKEKKENILILEKFLNSFQPNFLLPEINSIIVRF